MVHANGATIVGIRRGRVIVNKRTISKVQITSVVVDRSTDFTGVVSAESGVEGIQLSATTILNCSTSLVRTIRVVVAYGTTVEHQGTIVTDSSTTGV